MRRRINWTSTDPNLCEVSHSICCTAIGHDREDLVSLACSLLRAEKVLIIVIEADSCQEVSNHPVEVGICIPCGAPSSPRRRCLRGVGCARKPSMFC